MFNNYFKFLFLFWRKINENKMFTQILQINPEIFKQPSLKIKFLKMKKKIV